MLPTGGRIRDGVLSTEIEIDVGGLVERGTIEYKRTWSLRERKMN